MISFLKKAFLHGWKDEIQTIEFIFKVMINIRIVILILIYDENNSNDFSLLQNTRFMSIYIFNQQSQNSDGNSILYLSRSFLN
jgi:hypothetical protein